MLLHTGLVSVCILFMHVYSLAGKMGFGSSKLLVETKV
jgi:hypothetical protein